MLKLTFNGSRGGEVLVHSYCMQCKSYYRGMGECDQCEPAVENTEIENSIAPIMAVPTMGFVFILLALLNDPLNIASLSYPLQQIISILLSYITLIFAIASLCLSCRPISIKEALYASSSISTGIMIVLVMLGFYMSTQF